MQFTFMMCNRDEMIPPCNSQFSKDTLKTIHLSQKFKIHYSKPSTHKFTLSLLF